MVKFTSHKGKHWFWAMGMRPFLAPNFSRLIAQLRMQKFSFPHEKPLCRGDNPYIRTYLFSLLDIYTDSIQLYLYKFRHCNMVDTPDNRRYLYYSLFRSNHLHRYMKIHLLFHCDRWRRFYKQAAVWSMDLRHIHKTGL